MRIAIAAAGSLLVLAFGIFGLLVMNDWGLVAASHEPLDRTLDAMQRAEQDRALVPGGIFIVLAVAAAAGPAFAALISSELPAWALAAIYLALLVLGSPAYFMFSFANLNSIGDTYADWDSEAVQRLEAPLYSTSLGAMIVLVLLLAVVGVRRLARITPGDRPPA